MDVQGALRNHGKASACFSSKRGSAAGPLRQIKGARRPKEIRRPWSGHWRIPRVEAATDRPTWRYSGTGCVGSICNLCQPSRGRQPIDLSQYLSLAAALASGKTSDRGRAMQDYQSQIEKLRREAAECALIRDLATEKPKRELFDRLAKHLTELANDVERAMVEQKTG